MYVILTLPIEFWPKSQNFTDTLNSWSKYLVLTQIFIAFLHETDPGNTWWFGLKLLLLSSSFYLEDPSWPPHKGLKWQLISWPMLQLVEDEWRGGQSDISSKRQSAGVYKQVDTCSVRSEILLHRAPLFLQTRFTAATGCCCCHFFFSSLEVSTF